jgi:serine/threonine protein kinase
LEHLRTFRFSRKVSLKTAKYFAPEIAEFQPSGRSADIFSLGCVFFEMVGLCNGLTLDAMKMLRPNKDCSFHANIDGIINWFNVSSGTADGRINQILMGIVREMLAWNSDERPTAADIEHHLKIIDGFCLPPLTLWAYCCKSLLGQSVSGNNLDFHDANILPVTIAIGNTYYHDGPRHRWKFTVRSTSEAVDKIHVFLVRISNEIHFYTPFSNYP